MRALSVQDIQALRERRWRMGLTPERMAEMKADAKAYHDAAELNPATAADDCGCGSERNRDTERRKVPPTRRKV